MYNPFTCKIGCSIRGVFRQGGWGLLVGGVLVLGGCRPDPDLRDPVPVATPYNLQVPASLHATPRVPQDNPLTNEGVELGRFLFYEELLSADNSISCGSCHQQAKAFTDGLAVARGVGGALGTRSTMSLANVMWVDSLNWDFKAAGIEQQNRLPIENPVEMHQSLAVGVSKLRATEKYPAMFERAFGTRDITEDRVLKALAQFQRTLISGRSKFDLSRIPGSGVQLTAQEDSGYVLFTTHPDPDVVLTDPVTGEDLIDPVTGRVATLRGGNCGDCHGSGGLFKLTNRLKANNGLDDAPADPGIGGVTGRAADQGVFAIPTLRNVELTAPYMHDGRFGTLEQVLDHYSDHVRRGSPNLTPDMLTKNDHFAPQLELRGYEKRAIIAFLKTLTDTEFVTNPKFSDPGR